MCAQKIDKGLSSLASIRDKVRSTKPTKKKIKNDIEGVIEDGVDHINVWMSNTQLGKFLAGETPDYPFEHAVLGKFKTLEGFKCHISSTNPVQAFRNAYQKVLRFHVAKNGSRRRVENLIAIMMDATYQRMMQYPAMAELFMNNTLPLVAYYVRDGYRYPSKGAEYYLQGYQIIREAILKNTTPDFRSIMTDSKKGLYDDITPAYLRAAGGKTEASVAECQEDLESASEVVEETSDFDITSCASVDTYAYQDMTASCGSVSSYVAVDVPLEPQVTTQQAVAMDDSVSASPI